MEISAPLVTAAGDVTERDTRDRLVTNTRHLHVAPDTQARSRSPVTVQEWVAALPPLEDHGPDHPEDNMAHSEQTEQAGAEDKDSVEDKMDESSDNIKLGEEAGYFVTEGVKNFGQLLLQKNNKNIRSSLQHSDTMTSLKSDATSSSMDSVLQSREVDPEEVLYNLGFADSEALAKIPRRFLQKPSVAKGVSIENFRKQQEEIFGRYETGFFGYRGLQGGLHRRPSELVDKILKTLREREMEFQRSGSLALSQGSHAIPARFKVMDPNRTTFSALVKQVADRDRRDKPASFRSLARSVLSRENRIWRQQQIRANNQKATQLLVIGGKSFIVDDEGNEEELLDNSKQSVLSEESGFNEEADDGGEGEGGHSQHTQLLYTRKNDRKSFTEYFSNDNSSDKSAK